MKQIPSDKYSLAWFTLAECVSRGEKVRALSLYRLLAHSIEDPAFTVQLKGDILLAFKDDQAVDLYQEAADLYSAQERFLEAVGVYEHLLFLDPTQQRYIRRLIKLYKKLDIQFKVISHLYSLYDLVSCDAQVDKLCEVVELFEQNQVRAKDSLKAYQDFVFFLLEQKAPDYEVLVKYAQKVVDCLLESNNKRAVQKYLSDVESIDNDLYLQLCEYLVNES